MPDQREICFVIAPIGEAGGETRRRSDQILIHIIKPVVEQEYDYRAFRSDQLPEPGMISDQVIQHLMDDALVVADLTDRNPNVFYELAVRHAARKPVIAMIAADQPIPFDVSQSRTIKFDHRDLDSVAECKRDLSAQVQAIRQNPHSSFTPISRALDFRAMASSGEPGEQRDAHIVELLRSLQYEMRELGNRITHVEEPFENRPVRYLTTNFVKGEEIEHAKFGRGRVVEVGDGKLVARFGKNERTFVPEMAPLSKVPVADD